MFCSIYCENLGYKWLSCGKGNRYFLSLLVNLCKKQLHILSQDTRPGYDKISTWFRWCNRLYFHKTFSFVQFLLIPANFLHNLLLRFLRIRIDTRCIPERRKVDRQASFIPKRWQLFQARQIANNASLWACSS